MEAKTSIVKDVKGNGTYDSQHGMLYKFEYLFEDGTLLNANHKSQNHFKIGDEVEYKVKGSNDYGSWGTVSKPQTNGYNGYKPKSSQGSTASFALSYAKDLAVAEIANGKTFDTQYTLSIATDFNNWLKSNS